MPEGGREPTLQSDHLLDLRLGRQAHVLGDSLALVEHDHHRHATHAVFACGRWGLVNVDFHQDYVVPKASFTLDGKVAMQDGEFVLGEA